MAEEPEVLVPLPKFTPAANKRSPNRRPRYRTVLARWDKDQLKALFLKYYDMTGDTKISMQRIDIKANVLWRWQHQDPLFKIQIQEIAAEWKDIHAGQIRNLYSLSIERLEWTLLHTEDERLAIELARFLLKSGDIVHDTAKVEHTGKDGKPIEFVRRVEFVEVRVLEDGTTEEVAIFDVEPKALEAPDAGPE